jgi:cytosine/adenosine deaminase-related metal-dependent hydrolase
VIKVYALINAKIYDYQNYIDNGFVVFEDRIIEKGKMSEYKNKGYQEIDLKGSLLLPGFVAGHTHLYSTLARGANFDFHPQNFVEILKQLWWKVDNFLDEKMIYSSALMGALNQLKFGSTTLIDHHASKLTKGSLKIVRQAVTNKLKLRGIYAFETSDRFNIEESIEENLEFINEYPNHGLFGMHASLSLSDESLKKIAAKLNGNGIHIHVAESQMDEDDCLDKYGMRVVERLEKFNLLNEKSLLVHCTHIDEAEMEIIKKHNCTIAVNVTSNLNNSVGISKIKAFLDKGIRVIAGNDGLIPSMPMEYLNIFYLSHLKTESPVGFGFDDLKQIILNTYEYTNLITGTSLGKIEKDAEADLLVCEYQAFTPIYEGNIFAHLFYGVFPGFKPKRVIVSGKTVIDDYDFVEDYSQEYQEGINQANRLWELLEKEGKNIEFNY